MLLTFMSKKQLTKSSRKSAFFLTKEMIVCGSPANSSSPSIRTQILVSIACCVERVSNPEINSLNDHGFSKSSPQRSFDDSCAYNLARVFIRDYKRSEPGIIGEDLE